MCPSVAEERFDPIIVLETAVAKEFQQIYLIVNSSQNHAVNQIFDNRAQLIAMSAKANSAVEAQWVI